MKLYKYGMRLRPVGIGCPPKGFKSYGDDPNGIYHNILIYEVKLSDKLVEEYELDYLGECE